MTKDEIIKRVEWMTTSSVELSQPVLVYNDGFKDGANFVLQNLQQTQCTTLLEFLEQMLNEVSQYDSDGYLSAEMAIEDIKKADAISYVIQMIKDCQPIE